MAIVADSSDRRVLYQKYTELMIVILIISVACGIGATMFSEYKRRAWMTSVVGEFTNNRKTSLLYYALNGKWPTDRNELETFELKTGWRHDPSAVYTGQKIFNQMDVEKGAIHLYLSDGLLGNRRVVTFRPAVPAVDRTGPVIWQVKKAPDPEQWIVSGRDMTNIRDSVIGRYLQ